MLLLALWLALKRFLVEIEAICLVSDARWAGLTWILRRAPAAISGVLAAVGSCQVLFGVAEGTRCLHSSLIMRLLIDATILFRAARR